jgi:para-nitrobenzyl esterase
MMMESDLRRPAQAALAVLALMAGIARAHARSVAADPLTVVETNSGKVRGTLGNDVLEFKGIPYASPPTGNLRWELPERVQDWTYVRDATRYQSACPQLERYGIPESSESEDCLYLNVTVPAPNDHPVEGKRPVIVWIHGGAFVGGSSGLYDLSELAKAGDVVVVSMNYRLGVFGFMPHPKFAPGFNGAYGLEDQRAALRWVNENIEKFHGDKDNVTLAGESAGASSVCMHILAPDRTQDSSGKPLFHKAIIQSGGCAFQLRYVTQGAKQLGKRVGEIIGCTEDNALECLRNASVKDLLNAGQAAVGSNLLGFAPTYGTLAVPRQSDEALAKGQFVKVPMINGGNRDELRLYVAYDLIAGHLTTRDNFKKRIEETYACKAPAVLAQYKPREDLSSASWLGTIWSDFHPDIGLNVCLFLRGAQLASKYVTVYQYEFADPDAPDVVKHPVTEEKMIKMGAVHSAELPYQFPGFSNTMKRDDPCLKPPQKKLAKLMMEYWTSFARTGKPVAKDAPHDLQVWEPFTTEEKVLWFEPDKLHYFNVDQEHQCGFWRQLYPEFLDMKYGATPQGS